MIRVITQRDVIRSVADRWAEQYDLRSERPKYPTFAPAVWLQLKALDGETATPEDVAKIIGNTSWTRLECGVCDAQVEAVVAVGEDREDGDQIKMCCRCAFEAAKRITEVAK